MGATRQTINISGSGLPFTDTFVNNFRLIGPGTGNDLFGHDTIRFTINANGDLTAEVVNSSVECR